MKTIMVLSMAAGLLFAATVSADTIYSWTDEQGVQRFSNDPPPEGIENFQTFESQASPPQTQNAVNERRPGYDRMVKQASDEAQQLERQREAQALARAEEKKRLAEAQRKEKIQAQRILLEQQIKSINKRALGPAFTQGMKQAQIDKIKKQIEALESKSDSDNTQQQ